jgi:hypothetical protein
MTFHPWALLIAVPPVLAFFFLVWKVRNAESGKRFPFSDVLLRPPGESCRQKLTFLYNDLAFRILWLVVPVIFACPHSMFP